MASNVAGLATQVIVMAIVVSVILLFLGIGVLVLIHVCIVGQTVRRGLTNNNNNNDNNVNSMVERGSLGSTSMSQDDIEKLPCFDFKAKEKGSSPIGDCAVCLEKFVVGEKCRLLPSCNHSFHAECVDLWLLRAPICPVCRGGADSMKSGSLIGDESNRFSESGIEIVDSNGNSLNSSERVIEVRVSQEMGASNLSENHGSDLQLNDN